MIHCLPNLKFNFSARAIMKNRRLFFMMCLLFFFNSLYAQTSISGRVMSGDTALIGVTVAVKGTATTTQTNDAGRYNISAPGNAVLIFTYVGYASQEIPVNNRSTVDVKMESSVRS